MALPASLLLEAPLFFARRKLRLRLRGIASDAPALPTRKPEGCSQRLGRLTPHPSNPHFPHPPPSPLSTEQPHGLLRAAGAPAARSERPKRLVERPLEQQQQQQVSVSQTRMTNQAGASGSGSPRTAAKSHASSPISSPEQIRLAHLRQSVTGASPAELRNKPLSSSVAPSLSQTLDARESMSELMKTTTTATATATSFVGRSPGAEQQKNKVLSLLQQVEQEVAHPSGGMDKIGMITHLLEACKFFQTENEQLEAVVQRGLQKEEDLRLKCKELEQSIADLRQEFVKYGASETLMPDMASTDIIQDSVKQLEADILHLETNQPSSQRRAPPMKNAKSLGPQGFYIHLLHTKFERMEELIVLLKKRVHKLEEVDHGRKKLMDDYGGLSELLEKARVLEHQNEILKQREKRFFADNLLRRRKLMECNADFLRVMVVSLQSELAASRRVIESFNLENNRSLKFLVQPPIRQPLLTEYRRLEDMGAEPSFLEMPIVDSQVPMAPSALQQLRQENWALSQKLNGVEHANLALQSQVTMLEQELKIVQRAEVVVLSDTDAKGRKVEELTRINNQLVAEIKQCQKELLQKNEIMGYQTDVIRDLTDQKAQVDLQLVHLSQQQLATFQRMEHLSDRIARQQECCRSFYYLCVSLIHAQMEKFLKDGGRRLSGAEARHLTDLAYRDMMRIYLLSSRAAVTLQSWFRAWRTRKSLGISQSRKVSLAAGAVPRPSADPTSVADASPSEDFFPTLLELESSSAVGLSNVTLLDSVHCLFQALTLADSTTTQHATNYVKLLHLLKKELCSGMKTQVQKTIGAAFASFQSDVKRLMDGMKHSFQYPRVERSIQSVLYDKHESAVQCSVPVKDSQVQFDEALSAGAAGAGAGTGAAGPGKGGAGKK